jgi:hypothetical protein
MSNSHKRNITSALIDTVMFGMFIVTTAPQFTGIGIHEWLSIVLAGVTIVHLVRNWTWLVATTAKLVQPGTTVHNKTSIVLNIVLFVLFALLVYSGIAISESIMPWLGIEWLANQNWLRLHNLFSTLTVITMSAHVALHWNWITGLFHKRQRPTTSTTSEAH